MADQQRWFKLWYSAVSDDRLCELSPAHRWAWVAFGAYTKVHGSGGTVEVSASNTVLAAQMGVPLEALKSTIELFPNMRVEECKNRHASFRVTWFNWIKYQRDSTQAARASASRSKRRGEENKKKKRKELPPLDTTLPPEGLTATNGQPLFKINSQILEALAKSPRLGNVPRLRRPDFWQAEVRANPGVGMGEQVYKAEAWLASHPERHYKRLEGFLHNWLARADRVPLEDA